MPQEDLIVFDQSMELAPTPKGRPADKIKKNGWKPLDSRGVMMDIDKSRLCVDKSYQREEVEKKVIDIASDFSWRACGVVTVMQRSNNSYYVVDGQHRVLAAFKRSDIQKIPCIVFDSTGVESEAECFINANTKRKPVTAYDKFRASLVAKHLTAIELQEIVTENGLILKKHGHTPGTITCIATCQRIMRSYEGTGLRRALSLAAELAKADGIAVSDVLLSGLAYLDQRVDSGLHNARLRQQLIKIGGKALFDSARKMSYRVGAGGNKIWAEGMLEIVNRSLRAKISFNNASA
jgi:hypothetical protein